MDFTAIYGTFDSNMLPLKVIDVKNFVVKKFLLLNEIVIPSGTNFNECFNDPDSSQRKFLQLHVGTRKYNIIGDNYGFNIEVNLNDDQKHIKLIYYVYIDRRSNWKSIVSGQLMQLKSYGLLDEVDLYVHVTDTENIFIDVIVIIEDICKDAVISTSSKNQYEYPGIKLLHDLVKSDPDAVYLYLHTKGMSTHTQSRTKIEIALLAGTFENWRRKIEIFKDININKIGLFPSSGAGFFKNVFGINEGWIWFNFWYAKGSYLINCREPIVYGIRYYYEGWLTMLKSNELLLKNDCYSLFEKNNTKYFTDIEAAAEIMYLSQQL